MKAEREDVEGEETAGNPSGTPGEITSMEKTRAVSKKRLIKCKGNQRQREMGRGQSSTCLAKYEGWVSALLGPPAGRYSWAEPASAGVAT